MAKKSAKDLRIEGYYENSTPFAKPILKHLRKMLQAGCPKAIETIKWNKPWFEYNGKLLGGAVGFKAHCALILNKGKQIKGPKGESLFKEVGALRKIASLEDLPDAKTLKFYVQQAARLNEDGAVLEKRVVKKRPPFKCPADLMKALKASPKALASYKEMIATTQRHYCEWVEDAKTPTTRADRVAKSVKCIAAGKPRHWK